MRLIDADAFKEYLKNAFEEVKHMYPDGGGFARQITEDFCRDIDEQPTINVKPRWIPCSERLPEPRTDVWCNSDMGQMVGYYEENVETWYGRDYLELMVTAWMPLPEPFRSKEK